MIRIKNNRWDFCVPSDFELSLERGVPGTGLFPSSVFDLLTPDQIANFDWPREKIDSLIPFAVEPSTATLCWNGSTAGINAEVIHSLADSHTGLWYAPSYTGALYRMVLEDLSGTTVPNNESLDIQSYVRLVLDICTLLQTLGEGAWASSISEPLKHPPRPGLGGLPSFVSFKDVRQLLQADPRFERLGTEIAHLKAEFR